MNAVILSCLVICLGLYGVIARRDIIAVLAAIEVMLGGATLLIVSLSATYMPVMVPGGDVTGMATRGQALGMLLLAVIASEAAVGLALLVTLVRRGRTRMSEIEEVKG